MRPGFGDPELLRLADQPGVALNGAEEQRLDDAWYRLQVGRACAQIKRPPCGGCRRR